MAKVDGPEPVRSQSKGGWVTIAVAALGIFGTIGSGALGYQSGALSVNKDYVQMAIHNLQDENASPELRRWSVDVLNKLAPIPFNEELKDQLIVSRPVAPDTSEAMVAPCRDVQSEIESKRGADGARLSDKDIALTYIVAYEECKFKHSNLAQWLADYRQSLTVAEAKVSVEN